MHKSTNGMQRAGLASVPGSLGMREEGRERRAWYVRPHCNAVNDVTPRFLGVWIWHGLVRILFAMSAYNYFFSSSSSSSSSLNFTMALSHALSDGNDVFVYVWLPTGFGKSICFQALPFVFDYKLNLVSTIL